MKGFGLDSGGLRSGPVVDSCGRGNGPSFSVKGGEFLI